MVKGMAGAMDLVSSDNKVSVYRYYSTTVYACRAVRTSCTLTCLYSVVYLLVW